jgi:hypothetical protein
LLAGIVVAKEDETGPLRPERRQWNQPRSANAESPPVKKAKKVEFGSPVRLLLARSPFSPDHHHLLIFSTADFHQSISKLPQTQETCPRLTLCISVPLETMPVQTQTRTQPAPTSDPFSDPNPIRLVAPKVSSKRDTAVDNHREPTSTRAQDPHRSKPTRSQTQQPIGSAGDLSILLRVQCSFFLSSPTVATAAHRFPLLVVLYPKTLPQRRPSQKKPRTPSAQARRSPHTQTLSIASIFQALARVSTVFTSLDNSTHPMTNVISP